MKKLILGLLLLLAPPIYADVIQANVGIPVTAVDSEDLTVATGTAPFDYSLAIGTNGASAFTWQTIYSAAPTTVTVLLQASTDCSTYSTIDTSTNNAGEVRSIFGAWRCVRINNTVATGGAGKTLTVKFMYSTGRAVSSASGAPVFPSSTFLGPILLPDGSAGAPSLAWNNGGTYNTGLYKGDVASIIWSSQGSRVGALSGQGITFGAGGGLRWTQGAGDPLTTVDTIILRDAPNTLALRNGGTSGTPVPQTFNIYNFCDGANCATGYARFTIGTTGPAGVTIRTQAAGTGSLGTIQVFGNANADSITLANSAGAGFYIGGTYFRPTGNDAQDLGDASQTTSFRNVFLTRSIQGSKTKTLTESVATAFVNIAIPDGGHVGGDVIYDIWCADATPNFVARSCEADFACINKADTENCSVATPVCSGDANSSAGSFSANTLDYIAGTNSINLRETATCSLAQTVLEIHYRLNLTDTATITPQ